MKIFLLYWNLLLKLETEYNFVEHNNSRYSYKAYKHD
jgi:hypothetical protein